MVFKPYPEMPLALFWLTEELLLFRCTTTDVFLCQFCQTGEEGGQRKRSDASHASDVLCGSAAVTT